MVDWLNEVTTHPVFVWLGGFALATLLLLAILGQIKPTDKDAPTHDPFVALKNGLGAKALPGFWFGLAVLAWGTIVFLLFTGLLSVIWSVITTFLPADPTTANGMASVWEYRFLLAKLTALTGVLAAVVAFPLTVVRLRLSREDSETTKDSLYNDKINAALSDLHAQRQVTLKENGARETVWQDDIIRRAGAIDRLEALAHERPAMAPRIAAMLNVYVRELSREVPPVARPEDATPAALREWAQGLTPARRPDMEKATQTLGRLALVDGMTPDLLQIDLRDANLQGFDLSRLDFKQANLVRAHLEGARLGGAHLEGANLFRAHLVGANLFGAHLVGADLVGAHLEGANLGGARFDQSTDFDAANTTRAASKSVDLSNVPISSDQIQSMFGDGSVILPDTIPRPAHWPDTDLDWDDFDDEWRLWQSDPRTYVPPQHRD